VKFTRQGSITLRARLRETVDTSCLVRFEVEDTGIGISPDHMSRLFSAFEQAEASTTRKYGGTGLGLALSRKLARLMALPNLIAQSRVRQQELRTQIDTLKTQLDAEEGVELGLREEIDEGAVRRLLGGAE
jgi:signal transduction histidine kinase